MKKIEILGTGCSKCKALYRNVEKAVSELSLECDLEKVEDIEKILDYGVMVTPCLVIDGKVVSSGKLLTVGDVKKMLS